MSSPEKIAYSAIHLFIAAIGYFLIDMVVGDSGDNTNNGSIIDENTDDNVSDDSQNSDTVIEPVDPDINKVDPNSIANNQKERINATGNNTLGMVYGLVVDESGNPINGATINIYLGGNTILPHLDAQDKLNIEYVSDIRGRFELLGIEKSGTFTLTAYHQDFADAVSNPIYIKSGETIETPNIVMGHGVMIWGKITDEYGVPISAAVVDITDPIKFAFQNENERKPWKQVLSDQTGIYRIDNVSFRMVKLTARAKGFGTQEKQENLQFDSVTKKCVNFLLSPGVSISGMVSDEKGLALKDVKVQAILVKNKEYSSRSVTFSKENGYFLCEDLAEGAFIVRAAKDGYSDDIKQSVASGMMNLELVLKLRGGVSGVVLDWKTEKPLKKFEVRAMLGRKGRPQQVKSIQKFESKDGFYRMSNIEPGTYTFQVRAPGYADCASENVQVVRDYEIENVDVYMNKGGSVSGKVVDKKGAPVKGAKVTLNTNNFQDNPF